MLVEHFFPKNMHPPALVALFFGANDSALLDTNPQQHIPIREYEANLNNMVLYFKQNFPSTKIMVIAPGAIHEPSWGLQCRLKGRDGSDRLFAMTRLYANAACSVASNANVMLVDLFTEMTRSPEKDYDKFLSDGLHLSSQGNELLFEEVKNVLEVKAPSVHDLPFYVPSWSEVNAANPMETFGAHFKLPQH